MRRLAGAGLLALIVAMHAAAAADGLDALLAQARELAAAGRADEAYSLLAAAETSTSASRASTTRSAAPPWTRVSPRARPLHSPACWRSIRATPAR
jgi:hypothetical protein